MIFSKKELLESIQHDINHPKHELICILSKLQEIDPKRAEKLSRIIGKLEGFQNS